MGPGTALDGMCHNIMCNCMYAGLSCLWAWTICVPLLSTAVGMRSATIVALCGILALHHSSSHLCYTLTVVPRHPVPVFACCCQLPRLGEGAGFEQHCQLVSTLVHGGCTHSTMRSASLKHRATAASSPVMTCACSQLAATKWHCCCTTKGFASL